MTMPKWLERGWRWLEGLHTTVWLYTLFPAAVVASIGALSGIQLFWVLVGTSVVAAASLYLAQYFTRNVGWFGMAEASAYAFGKLENTVIAALVVRNNHNQERRLELMASYLAHNAPFYGKIPPSQERRLIDPDELKRGSFYEGGAAFRYTSDTHNKYIGLEMRKRDVEVAIKQMHKQSREFPGRGAA